MLSLPNILTLSRIAMIPLLAALLWWPSWHSGYLWAFVLYCLMGFTDYFDGYLARTSGAVSKLGIFLDPIADKIMVAVVIVVLTAQGLLRGPYVGDMHVIAGLIILVREIAVPTTNLACFERDATFDKGAHRWRLRRPSCSIRGSSQSR